MLVREPLLPLLFTSFVAAERECREGEEILEMVAPEGREQFVIVRIWRDGEATVLRPELLPGFG